MASMAGRSDRPGIIGRNTMSDITRAEFDTLVQKVEARKK
jgi:hypothetical protein